MCWVVSTWMLFLSIWITSGWTCSFLYKEIAFCTSWQLIHHLFIPVWDFILCLLFTGCFPAPLRGWSWVKHPGWERQKEQSGAGGDRPSQHTSVLLRQGGFIEQWLKLLNLSPAKSPLAIPHWMQSEGVSGKSSKEQPFLCRFWSCHSDSGLLERLHACWSGRGLVRSV